MTIPPLSKFESITPPSRRACFSHRTDVWHRLRSSQMALSALTPAHRCERRIPEANTTGR